MLSEHFLKIKIIKLNIACVAMLIRFFPSTCDGGEAWAAGPLFHQFKLTLESGDRTEALGPHQRALPIVIQDHLCSAVPCISLAVLDEH